MVTLELISQSEKTFKSLGIYDNKSHEYKESTLFPKNTVLQLSKGKFPLTDYKDLHKHSGLFYEINNIKLQMSGFCISCVKNKVGKYGKPHIIVSESNEEK